MHVGGIFCDLAKASDCVSHEILLSTLRSFSHSRRNKKLVQLLPNRLKTKEIKFNPSTYSNWGTIKHGVPKG
jgi:hypothetical protein